MPDLHNENLQQTKVSKEASLAGMISYAEYQQKKLETTIEQINDMRAELDAIDELLTKSSDDPETQDQLHSTHTILPPDLEPGNHSEDE